MKRTNIIPTINCAVAISTAALRTFAAEGYTDTPMQPNGKWHIHDPNRPKPPVVTPGKFSDMATPPSDAVVLFDGKDFSKWIGDKDPKKNPDGEVKWKLENGYMETTSTGVIRTKDEFGDFQMHLEFATPKEITGKDGKILKGQGRGNNGINIHGRYEIQVLDSYQNETYADGQASAIYGQQPPRFNASRPPGEWQTYDIFFEGPKFDEKGELKSKAYITVLHNGVLVHHRQEILGRTNHKEIGNYRNAREKGPIQLYEHGNPVRFRNIWIRPLGEYDAAAK
jgi:hypothetical protein